MALRLYLDDCANSNLLADLLRQGGHTVVRPSEVGLEGEDDDIHFAYAVTHDLCVVTKNPSDFLDLHDANHQHSGILAVHQDNVPTRDMSDAEIVKSIANLEQAAESGGELIHKGYHNLNLWRF